MKESKKALLKSVAVSGIVCATSYFLIRNTTKLLVDFALDKEEPKAIKKSKKLISGGKVSKEIIEKANEASEKLRNSETETLETVSHDGIKLTAHLKKCENPKRVIIAMHGWRSSWSKDFGLVADFWQECGCDVIYADQRGQNDSEYEHMSFGIEERFDCLTWVNFAVARYGNGMPVYLAGISMGATTVLMAAGLDLPSNVKGIIADCGFTSPYEEWKHVITNNLHLSYTIRGNMAEKFFKQKINYGTREYSTVEALKNCNIPVMFIHGTADNFVPVEMTYKNYLACPSEKTLFIVPGAGHGLSFLYEQEKYEKTEKEFFLQNDLK